MEKYRREIKEESSGYEYETRNFIGRLERSLLTLEPILPKEVDFNQAGKNTMGKGYMSFLLLF